MYSSVTQDNLAHPPQTGQGYPPQAGGCPPHQPGSYPTQHPGGYPPQQPGGYPPQQPGGHPSQQPGSGNPPVPAFQAVQVTLGFCLLLCSRLTSSCCLAPMSHVLDKERKKSSEFYVSSADSFTELCGPCLCIVQADQLKHGVNIAYSLCSSRSVNRFQYNLDLTLE